jgi:hypothetical protein
MTETWPHQDPRITYHQHDEGPIECGEYCGRTIYQFGVYVVEFIRGFTALIPHSGMRGTVGASPLPLDNPTVRAHLIQAAEELLAQDIAKTRASGCYCRRNDTLYDCLRNNATYAAPCCDGCPDA